MITRLRNNTWVKGLAIMMALNVFAQLFFPLTAMALTSGPSQPEVQGFTPAGTSDMVDVFSGDFTYNIPLMDIGGYPINISYSAGATMDEEASWVGLGWSLNVGAITRNMRGLPDDFNGDKIEQITSMKPTQNFGVTGSITGEFFGKAAPVPTVSFGISYNNYTGIGFTQSVKGNLSKSLGEKTSLDLGLGFSSSTQGGPSLSPSIGISRQESDKKRIDHSTDTKVGLGFSTRAGLTSLTLETESDMVANRKENKGKNVSLNGMNGESNISFVNTSYSPSSNVDRFNAAVNLSIKLGATFTGLDFDVSLSGYYSYSGIANTSKTTDGYGFIYNHNANPGDATLDFNREKDGSFSKNSVNLPLTNQTYDIYSISGQGVGGMFRAFRSDVGKVYDPTDRSDISFSGNLGIEVGQGNAASVGVDGGISGTVAKNGYWEDYNNAGDRLNNKAPLANSTFEPFYFKEAGEKTVDADYAFQGNIGYEKAVRVPVEELFGFETGSKTEYVDDHGNVQNISATGITRAERVKRNQSVSYLTAQDAQFFGVQTYVSPHAKPHHISQMEVTRNDGARYIYGIAAYNITQEEISFSVNKTASADGLVSYTASDRSTENNKGIDNYYSNTKTPAYAHSYLLTSVLSPDYSDVDGIEGPSPGDLGTYTKIDYDADPNTPGAQPSIANYKWRTPFDANKANYNQGLYSDPNDDKANLVYGEKEVWYVQKIETKTYVAIFHTSPRNDGYEAASIDGGIGNDRTMRLDSISLYALPDYQANGNNAEPIKRVHFDYNYTLCDGIPNSGTNDGKLTLSKIWFTYGKSRKGKLSAYQFVYHQNASYNNYNRNKNDRWGNYQEFTNWTDNQEFPYTEQFVYPNLEVPFTLKEIKLPSGGTIQINLEKDDYSYVQDQPAMRMFKISGCGTSATDNPTQGTTLYQKTISTNTVYNYLFFKRATGDDGVIDNYIKEIINDQTPVYFRFAVNLNDGSNANHVEFVSGYFQILSAGMSTTNNQYGYLEVKKVDEADGNNTDCHPVSKAAWQFGRKYNPRVVYNLPDPSTIDIEHVFDALTSSSMLSAVYELFAGANGVLRNKNYGATFIPSKSYVRLYNPTNAKIGGGYRVSKITLTDNWLDMGGDENATYGQEYFYTNEDGSSSGVATYEPMLGGDENPFRKPVAVNTKVLLAPDDENYVEEPFGESFFPSPSVGYGRVTVQNLSHAGVNRNATGKTVHEFYTTKDFPTIVDRTQLQTIRKKTNIAGTLLNISLKDYMTASQGFVIELNDMNGKPKSQKVYAQGKSEPITSVEYEYQTETRTMPVPFSNKTVSKKVLDNTVNVIQPNGDVTQAEVGVDYDIVNDFRKSRNYTFNAEADGNLATFLAAIFPGVVPTLFPDYSSETTEFKSVSTTKVINRYGVLKRTIAYDLGSKVSTENLAWDAQTGEVLLTQTENDFNDPVYNFSYPAHWSYSGMSQAYQNIGYQCNGSIGTNGVFSTVNSAHLAPFHKGDEVVVLTFQGLMIQSLGKAWVWDLDNNSQNGFSLIDKFGQPLANASTAGIKIIRSGRRNQQALAVGSVTSSKTPLRDLNTDGKYDALSFDNTTTKILNASAVEFSEKWAAFCNQQASYQNVTSVTQNYPVISSFTGTLNYLLQNNVFCSPSGQNLIPALPTDAYDLDPYYWQITDFCSSNNKTITSLLNASSAGVSKDCFVTLRYPEQTASTLPAGYTWGDLVSVSNLVAIPYQINGTPIISGNTNLVSMQGVFNNGSQSIILNLVANLDCVNFGTVNPASSCPQFSQSVVNPYVQGIRGVWRAVTSYTHLTNRTQTNTATNNNNLNIRTDGHYTSFAPFWKDPVSGPWIIDPVSYPSWTWTSTITQYSPFGMEVENQDALLRYSAAIYGYNNTLPKAVGANTDYRSMAFDGFEDYSFIYNNACCKEQFNFFGSTLVNTQHHTGRYAVQINASGSISSPVFNLSHVAAATVADDMPYTVKDKDIIGYYGPTTYGYTGSKKFVVSFWVKKNAAASPYTFSYDDLGLQVLINGSPATLSDMQKSVIIDGWQRYEYQFAITAGTSGTIQYVFNNSSGQTYYLDDFRVHPFNGSMKSFVYDPKTFRLMAELDERNFATLYEYDEEGALLRIKKETERGVMTIQESRNNLTKKAN